MEEMKAQDIACQIARNGDLTAQLAWSAQPPFKTVGAKQQLHELVELRCIDESCAMGTTVPIVVPDGIQSLDDRLSVSTQNQPPIGR
jgi:hypothetical protein